MSRNQNLPTANHGFTLAELLVYVAIFAIVAGLLTTIFYLVVNSEKKQAVSAEVNNQLNFILTTVQRLVGDASLVEAVYEGSNPSSTCATFCTLKLRRTDPAKDPTIISSNQTGIFLQEGTSPQVTLTTNRVLINHIRFTKHEIPGGHAVVEISTSFAYNTQNPSFAVTKAIESAIARVNAATFDADLLPNQDNTFDIGQIGGSNLRWKNGHFSQNLTVAGNVGIGIANPGTNLDVVGSGSFSQNLRVLGNLGVGTSNPDASSILHLSSSSFGFLPPRLTTTQRNSIASPASGLFLYNITTKTFDFYNGSSWQNIGGGGTASYVTSLPASPTDGQEVFYVASSANGVVWHLRYKSSSGYWEFLGGSPLYAEVAASEGTVSTVWTDLATVGPTITTPLAGDYMISHGALITGPLATVWFGAMSYAVGGTAAADVDAVWVYTTESDYTQRGKATVSRGGRKTGVAASAAITAKYRGGAGGYTTTYESRWITITPIRVQ